MNISKALKVKNRLAGEVSRLQEVFKRENSRRNDNPSQIDAAKVYIELEGVREKLISLKGAINEASSPVSVKLAKLAEYKQFINFINSVPNREGEELTLVGSNREKLSYQWTAWLNIEKIDKVASGIQLEINRLQDEIDLFNAQTSINFSE